MKKILIVTQQKIPHTGGMSTHIKILLSELKNNGYATKLIHGGECQLSKPEKILNLIFSLGNKDKFIYKNFNGLLENLTKKIKKSIIQFKPDVIHTHDVYASFAALNIQGVKLPPIVQTVHGPALYEAQMGGVDKKPHFKQLIINCEQKSFANLEHFIAVDTGQKVILVNDYKVDSEKIEVIFNGIDIGEVNRLLNNKINEKFKNPFFIVPRRLVEKTGVKYAIEALVKMQNKNCDLVIAGHGPLFKNLKQFSEKLKLENRVHFLGAVNRDTLIPLFKSSMGVIVPSIPANGVVEATSLAVTEAMASGTVPLASNIGGLAELIEDGKTGFLFTPGSSTELAKLMDTLLEDNEKRNEVIKNNSAKVKKEFSSSAWFHKIENIYYKAAN